jgi:hypothetical protein
VTTSRSLVLRTLLGAFLVSLALPAPSPAQTAQICLSGQYRNAGTAARGAAKCYVKSIKRGLPVDPACLTEREAWITSHFATNEAASNCLVEPAAAAVWATIQPMVTSLAGAVNENGSRCSSKKIGALGREFKQIQMCYAEMAETSAPSVDPACVAQAQTKLTDIFTRLEYNYICLTNGDAATLSSQVTTDATTVGDYLRGIGTTTTSTTTSTSSTTTLVSGACAENGSFDPCYAYRDNAACTACVDATVGPDAGIATTICAGATAEPVCADAIKNTACGYAINSSTTCGAICCP